MRSRQLKLADDLTCQLQSPATFSWRETMIRVFNSIMKGVKGPCRVGGVIRYPDILAGLIGTRRRGWVAVA